MSFLAQPAISPSQAKLGSTIQLRPVNLNARSSPPSMSSSQSQTRPISSANSWIQRMKDLRFSKTSLETGVGKPEDQNETSRSDHYPLGLQECLLLVGDSR